MISFIECWDRALEQTIFDKIKGVMEFSDIKKDSTFYSPDVAQKIIAESRGEATLEFMNLWRGLPYPDTGLLNNSKGTRGLSFTGADARVGGVSAVPVMMDYELKVWTKSLSKLNLVQEEILFWRYRNPTLNAVMVMLGQETPLRSEIVFDVNSSDASQVGEMFADGRYFSAVFRIKLRASIYKIRDIKLVNGITVSLYLSDDPEAKEKTLLVGQWELPK